MTAPPGNANTDQSLSHRNNFHPPRGEDIEGQIVFLTSSKPTHYDMIFKIFSSVSQNGFQGKLFTDLEGFFYIRNVPTPSNRIYVAFVSKYIR